MITPPSTNGVHHEADEAIDTLYSWFPPQGPAPAPLPEAAFSITLRGMLDGQDAMVTVRGMTADEFTRNLQVIRGLLDPVQVHGNSPTPQGEGWCPVHQVQMQEQAKEGRRWHSHRLDSGQWCKGR